MSQTGPMSRTDLATLAVLDPDQGVCAYGHACHMGERIGVRRCASCDYSGRALICWEITPEEIDAAEVEGAAPEIVAWARSFLAAR